MYPGQLILFPMIYRMEVIFDDTRLTPIAWDSDLPRQKGQYQQLTHPLTDGARVQVQYQLHVYKKRQRLEQDRDFRLRWVSVLAGAGTLLALSWIYLVQRRETERERQIDQAERLRMEEELRRQEAERLHEDAQRSLLEQRLATQAAERQALELNSRLYASIGIMAGSYAHNIKNLLVRPTTCCAAASKRTASPTIRSRCSTRSATPSAPSRNACSKFCGPSAATRTAPKCPGLT